ncbi:MAG: Gfo/Idh/MocA family protein [Bryobacteraceae bacterium]
MDRRAFLKTAIAFPAIVPATARGANDRITVGCIGAGRMGSGNLRSFLRHQDARVTAICDVQQSRREQHKALVDKTYADQACTTHNDFREMLDRKDIDAVMIATGERWHPIISAEAARRGKHIYCEKPLALTVAEAKAAREAVQRSGVVFQFGTQQRSSAYFRTACELARGGKLGQLQKIVIGCSGPGGSRQMEKPGPVPAGFDWDMWLGPAPWAPYSELRASLIWLAIYDYGLGSIGGSWGVHDIDFAQWANNSDHTTPISVEGAGTLYDDIRDTIATWEIEYAYANGVKIHFLNRAEAMKRYASYWTGEGNSVVLIGSEGWIWVSREGMKSHPAFLLRNFREPSGARVMASNDHKRNFLDAVRTGQPTISPIEAAAHDEMICQMGDIAVRLGRKLRWDPAKEDFAGEAQASRRLSRPMRSPWRVGAVGA